MDASANDLLLSKALALAESMEEPGSSLEDIGYFLYGLQEGFADSADPVENFPAYVILRLCRAMTLVMQRVDQQRCDSPNR